MAVKSKITILAQDLIRRMLNTGANISQEERNIIIESFIQRLKVSGYKDKQIKEIVESGLKGYESKKERAENEGRHLYRAARSSLASRQKKRLLGKTTWYKDKKKEDDGTVPEGRKASKSTVPEGWKAGASMRRSSQVQPRNAGTKSQPKTVSVLFVPRTKNGELTTRLRLVEEEISAITGDRIKMVEKAGKKLKSILHTPNPWSGGLCDRDGCLVCEHRGEEDSKCKQRNIVYKTSCLECKTRGMERNYFGESARTSFERGKEHVKDYLDEAEDSHMMKHHVTEHPNIKNPLDFSMKVIKTHKTPFARQVHEAVLIKMNEKNGILNSKAEFNRCQLPRLSVMMGVKEVEENLEAEMTQQEEEESMMKEKRKIVEILLYDKIDLQEGTCPPPSKRKKVWSKNIPKKRKRKKIVLTGVEDEVVPKIPKISDQNMPAGWRTNNRKPSENPVEEYTLKPNTYQQDGRKDERGAHKVLKHQQPVKIPKINDYFEKLNGNNGKPSNKEKQPQISPAKNLHIFKFSAVSQEGKQKQVCSSAKNECKVNSKPNLCKVMLTTTTTPSPLKAIKRVRLKKKLDDLPPPSWNYKRISQLFKPKLESESSKKP